MKLMIIRNIQQYVTERSTDIKTSYVLLPKTQNTPTITLSKFNKIKNEE